MDISLLFFGGAGVLVGLLGGAIAGVRRYRSMLGIGSIAAVLGFAILGTLISGDEKWWWIFTFLFANLISYAVCLGIGCAMRDLFAWIKAAYVAR